MLALQDYEVKEKLHEGTRSVVYRARRIDDGRNVILKLHRAEYPSPEQVTRYLREYEITRGFDTGAVVRAFQLKKIGNSFMMEIEDFGGQSLKSFLANRRLSIIEAVQLGMKIAARLADVHSKDVVHKDLNPSNIVYNPESGELKLIDFGISTDLSGETRSLQSPGHMEGTLAYISPEQTGRMNRSLDYRTDFYSFGVTLYEMLTNRVPFQHEDPMELVHSHIARHPVPPHEINPEIPRPVSDIVMQLMAKTAEDRYQSAHGIHLDLSKCLEQLEKTGRVEPFTPGTGDFSDRFQIPQKLYGREDEVAAMLAGFERVSAGATEMMLVAGYSGIGKTAMVREIYRPLTQSRGYFISGKYDQYQRNIPYSAIVHAFQEMVRQLLTETEEELRVWREELKKALGPNGILIVEVIPEVELIIGPQPPVQELGPTESRNRFNFVFQRFIRVFCDKPLAVFLDDLQWADSASLRLLESIFSDDEMKHLYLICAYRDNEVDENHPFMVMLTHLREAGAEIHSINLKPLERAHIAAMTAETLLRGEDEVRELVGLIIEKTGGNPFFVNQFLNTLYKNDLVQFSPEEHRWTWDPKRISDQAITDNVVDLMVDRLRRLPGQTQAVMRLAACIGNSFDIQTLATVCEDSPGNVYENMRPAVQEGLVVPLSDLRAEDPSRSDSALIFDEYRFLHDRVQQAAYALIDDSEKNRMHLSIGRLLIAGSESFEERITIFDLVGHINRGIDLIEDTAERERYCRLNLEAAEKAKDSLAYAAAREYLLSGLRLYVGDMWAQDYELAIKFYRSLAEIEYLTGDFNRSEELTREIIDRARTDVEKADAYTGLITQHTLTGRVPDAIQVGCEALALLGEDLPTENKKDAYEEELSAIRRNLGQRTIMSLLDLPELEDPRGRTIMRLYWKLIPPTYGLDQELMDVVIARGVNYLVVSERSVAEGAYIYASLGMILTRRNEYEDAFDFGILGRKMSEKYEDLAQKCLAIEIVHACLNHWKHHIKESHDMAREGYEAGLQSGELQFPGYTMMFHAYMRLFQGVEITQVISESENYLAFARKTKNSFAQDILTGILMVLANLRGETKAPNTFELGELTEDEYIKNLAVYNFGVFFFIARAQLAYIYGDDFRAALENLELAKPLIGFITGIVYIEEHNFFESLVLLALYDEATDQEKAEWPERVRKNQEQMQIWVEHCPENFLCRYELVEAELARIEGRRMDAVDAYERALASARENGFVQVEAVASERAATWWQASGHNRTARFYLQEARYAYQRWGAIRKVQLLDARYPDLVSRRETSSAGATTRTTGTNSSGSSSREDVSLDIASMMKAATAISGEIMLDQLLKTLMAVLLENAGAQRGYLILKKENRFIIEAETETGRAEATIMQGIPLEEGEGLSVAMVNYAIRTAQTLILADALEDERFQGDEYVQNNKIRSVLCVPLLHQGALIALVYMENNLATDAFTSDRVETVKLLALQTAVSLENALLYASLEDQVRERTAQLIEAEKMAALGSLVAGVAHEINTPVGIGVTAASTLQEETALFLRDLEKNKEGVPPKVQDYADVAVDSCRLILTNLDRAAELIQSFKQVAVDQHSLERREFNLTHYLAELVTSLSPRLKEAGLQVKIEGEEGITMNSYPGAISQIFTNLMMNTVDHGMQDRSEGSVVIEVIQRSDRVHIDYRDDGTGIPADVLPRIFEPFFSTRRKQGNTGLGMHIVYNLVSQRLMGTIQVERSEQGAHFRMQIPIAPATGG